MAAHSFSQREAVKLRRRKNRSSPSMTPASSCRLKRRDSTKPADLDFVLPPETSLSKLCRVKGQIKGSKKATAFVEPGNEKVVVIREPQLCSRRTETTLARCEHRFHSVTFTPEAERAEARPTGILCSRNDASGVRQATVSSLARCLVSLQKKEHAFRGCQRRRFASSQIRAGLSPPLCFYHQNGRGTYFLHG